MPISDKIEKDISSHNIAHAYLLIGNNQTELKEAIDSLIKHLACPKEDIIEIRPEDVSGKRGEIKAQAVKDFIRQISLTPRGKNRIGLIYGADRLNQSSANMLLKVLEEPPKYAILILVAESEAILPTIRSRCRLIKGENNFFSSQNSISLETLKSQSLKELFALIEENTKEGKAENLLEQIEYLMHEELLKNPEPTYGGLVQECEQSKIRISNNANPRLALEALVLKIREELNEKYLYKS